MVSEIATRSTSSFIFRSDVPKNEQGGHKSGILHASRTDLGREEQAFAWLDDRTHAAGVRSVVSHLESFGFVRKRMIFVPYGTMDDWMHRYPHACPYLQCDAEGVVTGLPNWQRRAGDHGADRERDAAAGRLAKRQRRGGPSAKNANKLIPSAALSDPERSCLHVEIYKYLVWLRSELNNVQDTAWGRCKISREGISVPGIQNIMTKLEATFSVIREFKTTEDEKRDTGEEGGSGGKSNHDGGGDASGENDGRAARDDGAKEGNALKLPLLEEYLKVHLGTTAEEAQRRNDADVPDEGNEGQSPYIGRESFDAMYRRLLAYKEREGHVNVPSRFEDKSLGRWVQDLRKSMKGLHARGLEHESSSECRSSLRTVPVAGGPLGLRVRFTDGKSGATVIGVDPNSVLKDEVKVGDRLLTVDGAEVARIEDLGGGTGREVRLFVFDAVRARPSHQQQSSTLLLKERVELLNSAGFAWTAPNVPKILPWEERLEMLKRYREEHDTWPGRLVKWNGQHIGEWCHKQRRFHAQNDKKFMAERKSKLDEIGFPWVLRKAMAETRWEDHFEMLEKFWRDNRHFNVPKPEEEPEDEGEVDSGPSEALRFYRWVRNIHLGYRNYKTGQGVKYGINEDRINQLLELGFKFEEKMRLDKPEREVPDIPFETRLDQVKRLRDQYGHCNIDFRFKGSDNLGGWAAKTSKLYKEWQEGKETLSLIEEGQFSQLAALGFEFNVFPVRERRTWEDNFNSFIEFRQQHGHGQVPLAYKADKRLGSWAGILRSQYKLYCEGKKSRLTKERYERLTEAGFVWEAAAGHRIFSK